MTDVICEIISKYGDMQNIICWLQVDRGFNIIVIHLDLDVDVVLHHDVVHLVTGVGGGAGGRRWSTATQSVAGQSMASHQSLHVNEHGWSN